MHNKLRAIRNVLIYVFVQNAGILMQISSIRPVGNYIINKRCSLRMCKALNTRISEYANIQICT